MKTSILKNIDLDYSKDSTIDSRILKICEDAEKTYIYNKSLQMSQKNINQGTQAYSTKDYHKEINNPMVTIPSFSKSPQQDVYCSPSSVYNNLGQSQSDMLFRSKTIPRNDYINMYASQEVSRPNPIMNDNMRRQTAHYNQKEFIDKYNSSIEKDPNLFRQNPMNNTPNVIQQQSPLMLKKIKHKDKNSKNNCLHCLMKNRIEQRSLDHYPHTSHITFQQGSDINKILLDAKTEMKKFHFIKAYNMLQIPISKGYYHSDLFYLYGEVCRLTKKLEESEDYLLLCLSFEHHSPYAYFSLGLLYQEIAQFKYSNSFFKIFMKHFDTSDVRFQMAKNYAELKKYLKSADNLTKAIEKNPECAEYYRFRADIYDLIGLTELSNDDINMVHSIKMNDDSLY